MWRSSSSTCRCIWASLSMSPGSANSASASRSMMPIWAFLAASSSCLSSRSIVSSSSLISMACGTVIGVRPVNSYFAGQLVDLVFVAEAVDELDQLAGERRVVVARARTRRAPDRGFALLRRRGGSDRGDSSAAGSARRFRGMRRRPTFAPRRSRRFPEFSASAPPAPPSAIRCVGPRPAIWLGSRWTARASSSSVSSRSSPKASMCSNAGETKSGGGCVGLGNRFGSYRWYVWMMPPRVSRLGMWLLYALRRRGVQPLWG